MSRNIWCLLGALLLSAFGVGDAVDPNCDYRQKLEPGRSYLIKVPSNAVNPAAASCRWHAVSDTTVKITCSDLNIPASPNCVSGSLDIYTNPAMGPYKYCGSGGFTKESTGNEMIITAATARGLRDMSFTCYLEATTRQGCSCGWKNPSKIVGGIETGVNEFPMMAAVISVASRQVFCGATIISNKHVLTAAHCLISFNVNNIGILVGEHDLTTGADTSATRLHRVAKFVMHPLYVNNKQDYDIAVVTLASTIAFTAQVGPACLPFGHYRDSFEGSYVDVLGWGSTEFAGATSNTLQKVRLTVPNYSSCRQYFPTLTTRQICTYGQGRDSCQFDSGGPVLWQNPTTRRLVHVGVISYGSFCAIDEPAVNTRVGSFLDWILYETPGADYCRAE